MKKIICFFLIILLLCACRRPVIYPIEPEIRFIRFEKHNETDGKLVFYFQDGDGDIGLNTTDTYPPFDSSSPFHYNFLCDCYEKQNGIFVKIDSKETINGEIEPWHINARIPRVSSLHEESINGEVSHEMTPYRTDSDYDTVKLKFYIVDRKLHKSNVDSVIVIR